MDKYKKLRKTFEEHKDSDIAEKMSAYMRNLFPYFGLPTPLRKKLTKDFFKEERKDKSIDWDFLDQCWQDDHREFQYLVVDYLMMKKKLLTYRDITKLEKYIRSKEWWDTIDGFDGILGDIAFVDERVDELMLQWSTDENFWVRRIAIDHQLSRKEKTKPELLEKILLNNLGSQEFFINKAIGWSLRDYSKTNPQWVRDFVDKYRDKMDKLSIKEASKYL